MMSSDAIDLSNKSDELQNRTEELKQSLVTWRNILLPLNNLLEWEHRYDPLIIFGILTTIFILIRQTDPSVLTFISCVVLIMVLMDLLVPIVIERIYKNESNFFKMMLRSSANDEKYSRLCERIVLLEQYIKQKRQSALKIRAERPTMYLMIGIIFLSFIAFCGQRIDNLLLTYFIVLIVSLIPGVYNRQLSLRHYISHVWNNNNTKSIPKTD